MKKIKKTVGTLISLLRILKYRVLPIQIVQHKKKNKQDNDILILGTGPSLNDFLDTGEFSKTYFAVNDFCLNKAFELVKPRYYFIADPAFLDGENLAERFQVLQKKVHSNLLNKVSWELTIFIPKFAKNIEQWEKLSEKNINIKIQKVNTNTIEGFDNISYYLYKKNYGMPLVQNVIIGAIFLSINLDYKNIYLTGVEHSLHEGIMVNQKSQLCIRTNHFDKNENYKLYYNGVDKNKIFKIHEFFLAWSRTFEGYHVLKKYADYMNVNIYNTTLKSYIDAFKKIKLEK